MKIKISNAGFTLPELLVAVGVFAVVIAIIASFYVQTFRVTRKVNSQSQIYEDARYIMQKIKQEIHASAIDYDEYYNQNVVIGNFGQNFGKYYSSFYNPGSDEKLGFYCNDKTTRNDPACTQLKKTVDKNTGENPFNGKFLSGNSGDENAFCGTVSYDLLQDPSAKKGDCAAVPNISELYLISADGKKKTILARERINFSATETPAYALSILRLDGIDTGGDGLVDSFACADGFQCRGKTYDVKGFNKTAKDFQCNGNNSLWPAELPRAKSTELEELSGSCDTKAGGFAKDFVPISPLSVNVSSLNFKIFPLEDPHYAFAEQDQASQPSVTITMTVEPNANSVGTDEKFNPITLTETIYAGVRTQIPAPVLVE